jgi:phosphoenolpyruvate carboxylase
MTEQGEVLSERYDDPHIAHRHLEQVLSATLACAAGAVKQQKLGDSTRSLLDRMAVRSRQSYRELVDHDGFIAYFEQATPISQIEQLPIGSRPSRRRAERSLATLRAIPWVFSWTQSRHMIPAWFGLGTALEETLKDPGAATVIRSLCEADPFFRAVIENAALALAKADMGIAHLHAGLAEDPKTREAIWKRIASEFRRTRRAVLDLTGRKRLLADVPWLKRSIEVRNPYVDPLNLIQVELFRRWRSLPDDSPEATEVAELIRLTIQGIAGGLRTTG